MHALFGTPARETTGVSPPAPAHRCARLRGSTRATAPLETVVLERTGHMRMVERPDAFNTGVGRFVDTPGD